MPGSDKAADQVHVARTKIDRAAAATARVRDRMSKALLLLDAPAKVNDEGVLERPAERRADLVAAAAFLAAAFLYEAIAILDGTSWPTALDYESV